MIKVSIIPVVVLFFVVMIAWQVFPKWLEEWRTNTLYQTTELSTAEKIFLEKSGRELVYPGEKFPIIETENVCELGKLTALTFLDWVSKNPDGVIALPTGKTPELFIEYLKYYKENWKDPKVQNDLQHYGITIENFPETKQLKFVQLDEFFPIDSTHQKSFTSYINHYYLNLLEIPKENVIGMDICSQNALYDLGYQELFPEGKVDLTLMQRPAQTEVERLQKQALKEAEEFCSHYENRIRDLGGIGFFLGGIGPDGHIAFNTQGAAHDSRTRLVKLNYPSSAAAAGDLGGIEHSRDKTAMTIGLDTITFKEDATIIIIAAGEAKSKVIADAVEQSKSEEFPATALHGKKGARFYLTKGAACQLEARRVEDVKKKKWEEFSLKDIEDVVTEVALKREKRILDLMQYDFDQYPRSRAFLEKCPDKLENLLVAVQERLVGKLEKGIHLPKNTTILHTGPHHDDVMLSYHPLMKKMVPNNQNHFAYLTSGFNSVTKHYMVNTLLKIPRKELDRHEREIFQEDYEITLRRFLHAAKTNDIARMEMIESVIMLKKVRDAFNLKTMQQLKAKVTWLTEEYFPHRLPGEKDIAEVQVLKGAMRESESERMLLLAGVDLLRIYHLRAKFYNGDYFNPMPSIDQDAKPVLDLCSQINPKCITVALDPEGTGPDTHYKVLQVVAQALRMGKVDPSTRVWGYRNVWHRFSFSEASILAPVTEEEMTAMNHAFLSCFSTQKTASFPPANYDGPFSELAELIQRDQYRQLRILLGPDYFDSHLNPLIRKAKGFVFIKEMNVNEFIQEAQELKSRIELI